MEEIPRNIQKTKQREKIPVWLPSHPPVAEVEADWFPMSENKPDLPKWESVPNLMGEKKTGLGAVWAVNGK